MPLQELLAPSIQTQPITVRKDENSDGLAVKQSAGRVYPLIRINKYICDYEEIVDVSITVAENFLPTVNITLTDVQHRIRESLEKDLNIVTIYAGNNKDPYFVKADCVVLDVISFPGSPKITLVTEFFVPEFHKSYIRSLGKVTSLEAIKTLCTEIGLGLLSNVSTTDDSQLYLQDSKTNLSMLKELVEGSFVADDTVLIAFVDQYFYLNIIDIKKACEDKTVTKLETDPYSGETLEEPLDVKFTSDVYKETPLKLVFWTNENNYGYLSKTIPGKQLISILDVEKPAPVTPVESKSVNEQILDNTNESDEMFSRNVHAKYDFAKVAREQIKLTYDQGQTISAKLKNPVLALYPYMYVPLEIMYIAKRAEIDDQEQDSAGHDDFAEEARATNTYKNEINTSLSGDYLIRKIEIRYRVNNVIEQIIMFKQLV